MPFILSKLAALFTLVLLALVPSITLAQAQARLEREGVVLYWGLVPAAVVSQKHALEDMHGIVPKDGGQVHHLVVALFNSKGTRSAHATLPAFMAESFITCMMAVAARTQRTQSQPPLASFLQTNSMKEGAAPWN